MLIVGRATTVQFIKISAGIATPSEVATDAAALAISKVYAEESRVATVHEGGRNFIWYLTTRKKIDTVDLGRKTAQEEEIRIAGDGRAMLVKNDKDAMVVWDLNTKKPCVWSKNEYRSEFQPISGGLVIYNDTCYQSTPLRKSIVVAEMDTGKIRERLLLPADPRQVWYFTRVSDDGKRIACLSADTDTVYCWERGGK